MSFIITNEGLENVNVPRYYKVEFNRFDNGNDTYIYTKLNPNLSEYYDENNQLDTYIDGAFNTSTYRVLPEQRGGKKKRNKSRRSKSRRNKSRRKRR